MNPLSRFYSSFFLSRLAYMVAGSIIVVYVLSYFVPFLMVVANVSLVLLIAAIVADTALLFSKAEGMAAGRRMAERFSNGDDNKVELGLVNNYRFRVYAQVIDEIPVQFQHRDWEVRLKIEPGEKLLHHYELRPMERGEYEFGSILVYAKSAFGLAKRRYAFGEKAKVAVYPSFFQMKKYQLLGVADRLSEAGVKKMRRIGQSHEFEQIKEYVKGDDFRNINWKATARRNNLMVNTYADEKSQQLYCIVDKGRSMKMPFEGLSLLDYSINASLVLSNTALMKKDKAGLITFSETAGAFLPATRNPAQMEHILETLYKQKTQFLESDYEALYANVRHRIKQRSLLALFTNFESVYSLQRAMPFLKSMAKFHLLLVVFFENTELKKITLNEASTMEEIYIKTIAEKFAFEKRLMEKELNKNGILTLLSPPQALTVNTINKYLEIKARQLM